LQLDPLSSPSFVIDYNSMAERTVNARASCAGGRKFVSQRPDKSYTDFQTVRHRFNIYAGSSVALALWRGDGSLQASA